MRDISEAKDPLLLGSMAAMQRAADQARKLAIQTGTDLIRMKDGKILRVTTQELIEEEKAAAKSP